MPAGDAQDVEGNVLKYEEILSEFEKCLIDVTTHSGGLEVFRSEYESLVLALQKSHESEVKLREKTHELEGNIQGTKDRVRKLKAEDEEISSRKRRFEADLEHNKKQVVELRKTSAGRRNKLEKLKQDSEVVQEKLSKGSGWSDEQQERYAQLEVRRESTERELETKQINLQTVKQEVEVLTGNVEHAQELHLECEQALSDMQDAVAGKKDEADRAMQRKEKLDQDLKALKGKLEEQQVILAEREELVVQGKNEIVELEHKLRIAKQRMEKYLREYDGLFHATNQVTEQLDTQARTNSEVRADLVSREEEIGFKQQEVLVAKKQTLRIQKLIEHTKKKIELFEAEMVTVAEERELVKVKSKEATIRVENRRREIENSKKQIDDLSREREILSKSLLKTEDKTKVADDLIRMQQNTKKNLENEIAGYKTEALRTRQAIEQLEVDVQRYDEEASEANQMYYTALEEVKLQEMQITELQKRILSGETKMKQQQNLYEAARSDRNLYSKNLIESQDEISEMKRKFKIMNHQIEQLKEEITTKDHALVKEHFDHHKVEKEKESLKNELLKIKKQVLSSEHIISNQSVEIQKLSQIIVEADEEKVRQAKEYAAVVAERDILGSQLIRRNDELEMLYEKLKIQKSTLSKGRQQYSARVATIKQLKAQLREIVKEFKLSDRQVHNMESLRREVFKLESELTQERSKVAAIQGELEKPLNVHRWRKLEGSDPERYRMIKKIQQLQRSIISQTDLVLEKDAKIQAKEKLYVELKTVLARQPGSVVAEQLSVYEANMKEKVGQMKFMERELETYRSQVDELKVELSQLNRAMRGLKRRYFVMMEERFFHSPVNSNQEPIQNESNKLLQTHHALAKGANAETRPETESPRARTGSM